MRRPGWYLRLLAQRLRQDPWSFPTAVALALQDRLPRTWRRALTPASRRCDDARKCAGLPPDRPPLCVPGRVSVVLPVYDQAGYLGAAIDSVLAQTHADLELIIVDDGSTDAVEPVLARALCDPRVVVLRQPNRGLPAALSAGFAAAQGEFLTWTSADNLMEPTMLEVLAQALHEHPDVAMVYGDFLVIDADGAPCPDAGFRLLDREAPGSPVVRLPRDTEWLNARFDNSIGPCFLYRDCVRRCVGDWHGELGVEDYDYWMRINAHFRIRHVASAVPLYRYRHHERSLTARAREIRLADKARALLQRERGRARVRRAPWAIRCAAGLGLDASCFDPRHRWLGADGAPPPGAKLLEIVAGGRELPGAAATFTVRVWRGTFEVPDRVADGESRVLHLTDDASTAARLAARTRRVARLPAGGLAALADFMLACADLAAANPGETAAGHPPPVRWRGPAPGAPLSAAPSPPTMRGP
jgi:hypothetical protein